MLAERSANGTKHWTTRIRFEPNIECYWIDFFDWNELVYRNYEYLRCMLPVSPILEYTSETEALIKFKDTQIMFDDKGRP
jgi:hypothetical protein